MEISGYKRSDGQIGIRNDIAVISTVVCARVVANKIARKTEGVQVFGRRSGCHESKPIFDKFVALGKHPNVAAVLVVGFGCERLEARDLAAEIATSGKPTRYLKIGEQGGTRKSISRGCRLIEELAQEIENVPRVKMPISDLVVAMDCAGSDATSGLASNPAVGAASDLLVKEGATVYCFNVEQELIGMDKEYIARAANKEVAQKLKQILPVGKKAPEPSLGNVNGGITNAKEKAIGAFAKAGTAKLQGVVDTFQKPAKPGLYLEVMVPGSFEDFSDPQCAMQMAAAGAHIVVETTGVGTVTGSVVAVTVKVCANPKTCEMLGDDIDIDAGGIMTGEKSVSQVGKEIYDYVLQVAQGKLTRSEELDHFED